MGKKPFYLRNDLKKLAIENSQQAQLYSPQIPSGP